MNKVIFPASAGRILYLGALVPVKIKLVKVATLNLVFRLSHFLATWSGVIFPVRPISFTIPLWTKHVNVETVTPDRSAYSVDDDVSLRP